mmetsp:Transcript_61425/g.173482  ORF Transcript_61425/g.173482 Transcript_61425/m.173482 type:complete len:265 (+) Transcript_61425:491-1285(+)
MPSEMTSKLWRASGSFLRTLSTASTSVVSSAYLWLTWASCLCWALPSLLLSAEAPFKAANASSATRSSATWAAAWSYENLPRLSASVATAAFSLASDNVTLAAASMSCRAATAAWSVGRASWAAASAAWRAARSASTPSTWPWASSTACCVATEMVCKRSPTMSTTEAWNSCRPSLTAPRLCRSIGASIFAAIVGTTAGSAASSALPMASHFASTGHSSAAGLRLVPGPEAAAEEARLEPRGAMAAKSFAHRPKVFQKWLEPPP